MGLPVLSDLEFNADDVATAVANKLSTENSNLGTLLDSAQSDHDDIEALLTSAQSDHDDIEDLLNSVSSVQKKQYLTSDLSNSWLAATFISSTSLEDGITIQKLGRIYIANILIEKDMGIQSFSETVCNLGTHIDHPNGTVVMGTTHFNNGTQNDYTASIQLNSNGDIVLYANNTSGDYHFVAGNFIGLDVS